jgi:hypothetical protein
LAALSQLVGKDLLMKMKNECGGLQTLLKNQYPAFAG